MSWARFDDQFWAHPKVIAAGNEAVGAFVRIVVYCCANLTDGHVPGGVADMIAGRREVLDRLVAVRLLATTDDGYVAPDFLEYNPPAEKIRQQRKQNADRLARWREAKSTEREDSRIDDVKRVTNTVANDVRNASRTAFVTPPPSRPVPSRPPSDVQKEESALASAHGASATPSQSSEKAPAVDEDGAVATPTAFALQSPPAEAPSAKSKRAKRTPLAYDPTPPEPGTVARRVYDAIVADPILREITLGPADYAKRVANPDMYPGVDLVRVVLGAGEYLSRGERTYSDGRQFLNNQFRRAADDAARKPKPALHVVPARAGTPPTLNRVELKLAAKDAELAAERAARGNAPVAPRPAWFVEAVAAKKDGTRD